MSAAGPMNPTESITQGKDMQEGTAKLGAPSARKRAFTPGPWGLESATRNESGSDIVITDHDGGYTIASCGSSTGVPNVEEAEANARLIAAAPDLYEALRAALEWEAATRARLGLPQIDAPAWRHAARIAVANVNGGAP